MSNSDTWLVDTNVISEVRRLRPNAAVIAFIENAAPNSLYVSEVSLAEIRFGIDVAFEPGLQAALTDWLANRIRPMFGSRVLAVSEDVLLRWRVLIEQGRKAGHTYSQPDLLLAATALEYGMTLVTRNLRDFRGLHVPLFSPWNESV